MLEVGFVKHTDEAIQETLYLQSIPDMVESIKAAAAESLIDGIDATKVNFLARIETE